MVNVKKLTKIPIPVVTLAISICFLIIYYIMILSEAKVAQVVTTWLGYSTDAVFRGKVWTLLSSMFVHTSLQHLLFNITFILLFGSLIEIKIGKKALIFIVFLGGFLGNIFHSFTNPSISLHLGSGWPAYTVTAIGLILLFNYLRQKVKK